MNGIARVAFQHPEKQWSKLWGSAVKLPEMKQVVDLRTNPQVDSVTL